MSYATPEKTSSASRYNWVDIAKGICIVAVVGLYARNELERMIGSAGWLDPWSAFARPFRMPDFFLLSGLFLSAVLDRPWRSYLDTKVIHYVYFLVLWILIILTYDVFFLGTESIPQTGIIGLLKVYVWKLIFPDHMLWFIQTLPVFFVLTRVLRGVPRWLLWTVAAIAMASQIRTGLSPIDNFIAYYAFFLAGHFGAKWIFNLADIAGANRIPTLLLFVLWCFVNHWAVDSGLTAMPGLDLFFGFLGITAIISFSSLLSPIKALDWLRFAGSNSIVIYLGFFIPLTLFLHLVSVSDLSIEPNTLATLAVVLGAGTPLLLFTLIKGTAMRFLFVRPSWAYIVAPRRKR